MRILLFKADVVVFSKGECVVIAFYGCVFGISSLVIDRYPHQFPSGRNPKLRGLFCLVAQARCMQCIINYFEIHLLYVVYNTFIAL